MQLADGITLEGYVSDNEEHVANLGAMFSRYLLEELDRTGRMALGTPASGFLLTMLIKVEGRYAGFLSLDLARCSIELVFIKAEFRGRGLATLALVATESYAPRPLAMKAPLSPGGAVLAERLGLSVAENDEEEAAESEQSVQVLESGVRARCTHKRRGGDPRRPCKRCYQWALRKYAQELVDDHARKMRELRKGRSRGAVTVRGV